MPDWLHALRTDVAAYEPQAAAEAAELDTELMASLGHIGRNFVTQGGKMATEAFLRRADDAYLAVLHVGNFTQGPPGCVNGGALYAAMDDAAGRAAWIVHAVPGFTRSMVVSYRKFTPILGRHFLIECRLAERNERRAVIAAELRSPATGVVHCTATVEFVVRAGGPRL